MDSDLKRELETLLLCDHHAHSLSKDFSLLDKQAFRRAFSETSSPSMVEAHVPNTMAYQKAINLLLAHVNLKSEDEYMQFRRQSNPQDLARDLFQAAGISAIIVDDGYQQASNLNLVEFKETSALPTFHCRRLESILESALIICPSLESLEEEFLRQSFEQSPNGLMAVKTIAAYRGGLDIALVKKPEAKANFDDWRKLAAASQRVRIEKSPLYHYLIGSAFAEAGRRNLPVQIHCGVGDADQDLRYTSPLCFRTMLECGQLNRTQFVFLHCYPFVQEAAYLSSLYENVYMDVSLGTYLAPGLAGRAFLEALSFCPYSKLMASTDGHAVPELFFYAGHMLRHGLKQALVDLIEQEMIGSDAALLVARQVLSETAMRLYQLPDS